VLPVLEIYGTVLGAAVDVLITMKSSQGYTVKRGDSRYCSASISADSDCWCDFRAVSAFQFTDC